MLVIWGGQPTNGFIMMNSPLGLICPCDPETAFALSYAEGDLQQAIIGCVNYGRDNDSYVTLAGAIAGALHGTRAIPLEWRDTVEVANPEPDMRALSLGLAQVA